MKGFLRLIAAYRWWVVTVSVLGLVANGLALYVPMISARVVDQAAAIADRGGLQGFAEGLPGGFWATILAGSLPMLLVVAVLAMLIAVIQIIFTTYFAEKVALGLRTRLVAKVGDQTFDYVSKSTPGHLLTVATSDVDAVKNVFAQGLVTLLGAAVTLVGAAILLITIDWKLALLTLSVIPLLIVTFAVVFGKLGKLFKEGQETLERINAVINESVVGAAIIRVLDAGSTEVKKFGVVNGRAREIGLSVVAGISALIPIIMLLSNVATLIIVWFGGRAVMAGGLSIGDLSAFISYSAMFVWPLFVLSFVGMTLSRGAVSLDRIQAVLDAPVGAEDGTYDGPIEGHVEFRGVTLRYAGDDGERTILKNVSFSIKAGTRNAIVGPTAAGKTQLFYLMSGLVDPSEGKVLIDGRPLSQYARQALLTKIGLVFQDSIVFNASLRENIAFSDASADDAKLHKAIKTAELDELVEALPDGLDTLVSERGTSLSGGQKQRMMLARALAVEPSILLLDDFTARVDRATEASILRNVREGYAGTTLVSITQKVEPIKDYDQVIVLMEGELVAVGTHAELIESSLEYRQISESQESTEAIDERGANGQSHE
jgi:ATP-binding cassette subfamily B protein